MSEKVRQEKINYYNNVSRDFLMGKLDDLGSILEDIAKKKYSKDAEVARVEEQLYQDILRTNKTDIEKRVRDNSFGNRINHEYINSYFDNMKRLEKMRERAEKKKIAN